MLTLVIAFALATVWIWLPPVLGFVVLCGLAFALAGPRGREQRHYFEPPRRPPDPNCRPQFVGRSCAQCKQKIITAWDARPCDECSEGVHIECLGRHKHGGGDGPYR